ncbi:MAG: hypothetical protein KAH72_00965 [Flavobacteriaceae bacterium]|nr:hypothetical protein [Flavobacteriaceae bacterium]
MTNFTISHPIVKTAINDLGFLLSNCEENIKNVSLFGSTLKLIPIEEAKDIDFLIDYEGSYEEIKSKIESINIGRNVVVQHMKMGYANCPTWEKENPLRIHILFYEKGRTKMSPKAIETENYALDITREVLKK